MVKRVVDGIMQPYLSQEQHPTRGRTWSRSPNLGAIVAVSLLHRSGYFTQHLDSSGWQTEAPAEWNVADFCEDLRPIVTISIEGRPVQLRAWKFDVRGVGGYVVPVYLLDSDLPTNSDWDRTLTHSLWWGCALSLMPRSCIRRGRTAHAAGIGV